MPILLLLLPLGDGCGLPDEVVCWAASVIMPAITVDVRDSVTGAPAALGALGIARGASVVDTMRVWDQADSANAHQLRTQRAGTGTFTVTIAKAGYTMWRRDSVLVTGDKCGPTTTMLSALLKPVATP